MVTMATVALCYNKLSKNDNNNNKRSINNKSISKLNIILTELIILAQLQITIFFCGGFVSDPSCSCGADIENLTNTALPNLNIYP
jgi:hypothetical protein